MNPPYWKCGSCPPKKPRLWLEMNFKSPVTLGFNAQSAERAREASAHDPSPGNAPRRWQVSTENRARRDPLSCTKERFKRRPTQKQLTRAGHLLCTTRCHTRFLGPHNNLTRVLPVLGADEDTVPHRAEGQPASHKG